MEEAFQTFHFDYEDCKHTIEAHANCFSITTKSLGDCWVHSTTVQIVDGQLQWRDHYMFGSEIKAYCEKLLRNRVYW